ncbi:TetR/AcrR family transcriptional regulator [Myxococcota bacterium]|nr:TetR/AcrR family transcriptional regulator [Myxococcota bacterium]MBU1537985.1 TetR/AcrR family transcriptional regulator [Myxococcota bacterium]
MIKRQPTEQRQKQIAMAALKIISVHGLRKFTTAAIAKEVGISDGTIFRHFANKSEIVTAALAMAEAILFENFPPESDEPLERLRLFFEQRAQIAISHPYIMHLIQTEQLVYAVSEPALVSFRKWKRRSIVFIEECLREAQDRDEIGQNIPVESLVIVVYGTLMGLLMTHSGTSPSPKTSTKKLWQTLELLLRRSWTGPCQ